MYVNGKVAGKKGQELSFWIWDRVNPLVSVPSFNACTHLYLCSSVYGRPPYAKKWSSIFLSREKKIADAPDLFRARPQWAAALAPHRHGDLCNHGTQWVRGRLLLQYLPLCPENTPCWEGWLFPAGMAAPAPAKSQVSQAQTGNHWLGNIAPALQSRERPVCS